MLVKIIPLSCQPTGCPARVIRNRPRTAPSVLSDRRHYTLLPALNWRRYPLVRVVLLLLAGIFLARYCDYTHPSPLIGYGGFAGLFSVLGYLAFRRRNPRSVIFGLLLIPFLIGAAYLLTVDRYGLNDTDHFSTTLSAAGDEVRLDLVLGEIKAGAASFRTEARVQRIGTATDSSWQAVTGKLLLYLPPDDRIEQLAAGSRIVAIGRINPIGPPLNPGGFDAQGYYSTHQVFHRIFLRSEEDWVLIGQPPRNGSIRQIAEAARNFSLTALRSHLNDRQFAVAAALVLGKKENLDQEIRDAYADTGAMHVLAVSGLHVGIVAWLLQLLCGRLIPGNRWKNWQIGLLTVTGIWAFALLTGLSSSVQRSAFMFSLLSIGSLAGRRTFSFNTLAVAALIMLLVDPFQAFQVGFQLSFSAVAGILFFQPYFNRAVFSRYRIVRQAWALLSVSLAAQLGTLPLTLYYFHQFPLYFLLSGTVVIFTAYGGLIAGLVHLFFAGLGQWSALVGVSKGLTWVSGTLLGWVIEAQNMTVFYFQKLPGATLEQLYPSTSAMAGLYGLILALGCWLVSRHSAWLYIILAGLVGLGLFRGVEARKRSLSRTAVVYHVNKKSLIDISRSDSAWALQSEEITEKDLQYTVEGWRGRAAIKSVYPISLDTGEITTGGIHYQHPLLQAAELTWFFLPKGYQSLSPSADSLIWVVRNNLRPKHIDNLADYHPSLILLDGSNNFYTRRDWQTAADSLQLPLWITSEQGAYIRKVD